MRILRLADRHPAAALLLVTGGCYLGLLAWSWRRSEPLLLARAEGSRRVDLYGQIASSSVALLAVSLTVLAILLALPDRPVISDLRSTAVWPRLQATLLVAALLCLITLVGAHVAAGIDGRQDAVEWLSLLVVSAAGGAVLSVLIGGIVFGLFLRASQQPLDPSVGRGE